MSYDVKFLKGSLERFNALPTKDAYTFYYVDEKDLYLGNRLLSNADEIAEAVKNIELNAAAIKTLQDELDALVDPEGTGGGSISTQINELRTQLTALISANDAAIKAEVTRATGAEADLAAQISTLALTVDTNETDIEGKVSSLTEKVNENTQNIATYSGIVSAVEGRVATAEGDIDTLQEATATLEEAIETLVGEDEGQSVRTIVLSELTKQLVTTDAKENLDTLQEIAAWIQSHPEDAADMNEKIAANESAIQALVQKDTTHDADIADLKEAVAALTGEGEDDGILALSKAYTDEQVATLNATIADNKAAAEEAIADLGDAIDAINDVNDGILAKANQAIATAISNLGLGTAAYEDVEAFDAAGAADAALVEAKAYTDNALSWGEIPETVVEE